MLGRIIEVVTAKVWDEALKGLLLTPLGLTQTMTLPEEALRFRAAMGHLGEPGQDPDPAPSWDLMPRSAGPYGRVIATAGDLARLARLHLTGGVAQDGTGVLSEETVALMQRQVADCPDKWTVSSDGWGLGWTLYDWNGVRGYGHDGASIGQYGYLRRSARTTRPSSSPPCGTARRASTSACAAGPRRRDRLRHAASGAAFRAP
ncbi:serine hydrolase [Streptomyces syringium]|uniref:serine hydrolase n=1 Tax=Streptomyces syringium TaxID=76729 RepID=UPI003F577B63